MKSVRLSELLRKQILDSVLQEFVSNQLKGTGCDSLQTYRDQTDVMATRLADKLWDSVYSGIDFSGTPPWALSKCRKLRVYQTEDSSCVFHHRTSGNRPCKGDRADLLVPLSQWSETFGSHIDRLEFCVGVVNSRKKLSQEIKPILDSVGSTKQLLEIWPSMEKFLPANIADPDSGINLPALNISRLQEKIMGEKDEN